MYRDNNRSSAARSPRHQSLPRSPSPPQAAVRSSRRSPSPPVTSRSRFNNIPPPAITRQSPSPPPLSMRGASSRTRSDSNKLTPNGRAHSLSPMESSRINSSRRDLDRGSQSSRSTTAMSTVTIESVKSSVNLPEQKSPYGKVAHSMKKMVPEKMACKVGCGGAKCKYDNADWPDEDMAITGLYSNWITNDILATARPRNKLIKDGDLIHNMKKAGIRSIFNMQSRGEHKDCGEGILEHTGYSYDPEDFSSSGIYYYNFELEDYGVVSPTVMIDMVRVFDFALTEGKVAVHCHAGLGRTGLLITSYLVYALRMTANQAIFFMRDRRRSSVQMETQIQAVKDFENFLRPLRIIYPQSSFHLNLINSVYYNDTDDSLSTDQNEQARVNQLVESTFKNGFNLNTFLMRQRFLLHGYERKTLKYVPKIVFVCCEQLKKLATKWKDDGADPYRLKQIEKISNELHKDYEEMSSENGRAGLGMKRNKSFDKELDQLNPINLIAKALLTDKFPLRIVRRIEEYQKSINEVSEAYQDLSLEEDPYVLSGLMWSWIDNLREPILRDQEINILFKRFQNPGSKRYHSYDKNRLNWKEIDKGCFFTTNCLAEVIHCLLPLEERIEDRLIVQLIKCLTHTYVTDESDQFDMSNDTVRLSNGTRTMNREKYNLLYKTIRDLVAEPFNLIQVDRRLPSRGDDTRKFNNGSSHYDYAQEIYS